MAFTDDDLKRLKEQHEDYKRQGITSVYTYHDILALIARLEAAEAMINNSRGLEGWWDVEKELEAWRKSAGKELK